MDPNRDYEGEARRDMEGLTPFDLWRFVMYCRWLLIRQKARRLYLRLCFPWLPAERVHWQR